MPDQRAICPICGFNWPGNEVSSQPVAHEFSCQKCGKFQVAGPRQMSELRHVPAFLKQKHGEHLSFQEATDLLKTYLSIYTRECFESRRPTAHILDLANPATLEDLAETYANTPIEQKPAKLLRLIARRTDFPGETVTITPATDHPAVHAVNPTEFAYYLQALVDDGCVETQEELLPFAQDVGMVLPATIRPAGWERLGGGGSLSRLGFVAMWFAEDLNSAFADGIESAIRDAGYEPLRVDKVHHNEKICDRIIVEIRRARFVVADVTGQRQGVYYEAGFAAALGLPVIWSCREDDLKNVHFDTRQYNHVVWTAPDDLREKLRDRIIASIGSA